MAGNVTPMYYVGLILLLALPCAHAEGEIYWIMVKGQKNLCLDVYGGKKDNGSPIDIWQCNYDSKGQQWYFDSGTYKLRSVLDESKCLDAGDMKQGTVAKLWDCNVESQQFFAYSTKTYTIYLYTTTGGNTMCLDVQNAQYKDGTPVQVYTCDGLANQGWMLAKPVPPPKPLVMKVASNNKYCLDLRGQQPKDGNPVDIWSCGKNIKGQEWYWASGTYKLQSAVDGTKCIDAGGMKFRGLLQLWTCNDSPQQQWGYDTSTGVIFLGKKKTTQSLCITLTDFKDGAQLQLYTCNGGSTEKWTISNGALGEAVPSWNETWPVDLV